jgi:ubiquinone/menaquinone biosynthesis C-methylase UbiE
VRSDPVFARFYGVLAALAERGELGRRRRQLLARAEGTVLELGAGTGENFKHYGVPVQRVIATEPDPTMLRLARRRQRSAPVEVDLVAAGGEALPVPDATVDTAVVTLVLCSVDDPAGVLAEVRRVLRPGGRLLFMEHVRAGDPSLARWQDRLAGPWSRMAGGCHPNRATLAAIEKAGFELDPAAVEAYDLRPGIPLVRPHVEGMAVRP